jgi:hypothetical protein
MSPADVLSALRKRPFEPFRIQVSDGTTYDVRHPELVMVGLGALAIGIPASGQEQPVYERLETVSLRHVVKLLPLTGAAAPKDGQQLE